MPAHLHAAAPFFALALLLAPALAGCAAQHDADFVQPSANQMPEPVDVPAAGASSVATVSKVVDVGDPDDPITITLLNELGSPITGFEVADGQEGGQAAQLAVVEEWANGGKAQVHYGVDEYVPEASDIVITLDKVSYVLHKVNFDYIAEASLRVSEGVAYVEYHLEDGTMVNTLARERAMLNDPTSALANSAMGDASLGGGEVYYDDSEYYYEEPAYYSYDEAAYGYQDESLGYDDETFSEGGYDAEYGEDGSAW